MSRAFALIALLAALLLSACGSDGEDQDEAAAPPPAPETETATTAQPPGKAGVPAPLAANAAEANEIVGGGQAELDRRLEALRGHPVVVNRWASWCPPCRTEFPFFQESAEAHGIEVAFIGLNTQEDPPPAAEQFLEELRFPGPSVEDPDGALADSLGILATSPSTVLIDEGGEVAFTRPGAYASADDLEQDIQQYLLGG